ncbi:hypothetical protein TRFO_13522 [Tritrichomonas foetus]|uniref:Uncharacterized protein n=1 Tax=Tritrichomonas foetus TaxID=1144522 RepID=A0A1J4KXQ1_9EUKA|nr:hypothetical protein TRFO_13522 [Tritrichomonas foetus]|eukprot:OHT16033.1 hypothetical protein TRFO_13522 [Tritrichomonas foetus]
MLFLFSILLLRQFNLTHTLWPPSLSEKGLFGRAVSFAGSRIAVSAEYVQVPGFVNHNKNYTGVVYIYDYDASSDNYVLNKGTDNNRIEPQAVDRINPGTLGSKVILSSDGKLLLAGAPYTDIRTDFSGIVLDPTQKVEFNEYQDGQYYAEVGALYLFREDEKGNWKQEYVSVPNNVVCKGGYGRSMSGSYDLHFFAGAYYNKIMPNLPDLIGQVFITSKNDQGYKQDQAILPPPEINNSETQRFGSSLTFHEKNKLYVTSLAEKPESQEEGDDGGVFEYHNKDGVWKLVANITESSAKSFDQFGIRSAFRGDDLAAIYGRKNTAPIQHNIFILPKVNDVWATTPQQTISFLDEEVTDLFFCSSTASKNNYLAIIVSNNIVIYEQNPDSLLYTLLQNITDPRIVHQDVTTPYEEQGVTFASDFSWDSNQCNKFIVGAMGRYGSGASSVPNEYSRSYVYELIDVEEPKSEDNTWLVVGCVVAAVVVIIIVILTIFMVRRNRVRNGHINMDIINKSHNDV